MTGIVVDLCAGAGGWDVAAAELGLSPVGVELDRWACETRVAAGLVTERADVREWQPDGPLAGIIESAPCTGWSEAGKQRGWDDPTGPLIETGMRLAIEHEPEWVAMENTRKVLPIFAAFAEDFRDMGYSAWAGLLHAEQYGVPQTRTRAILLASRVREVGPPTPTHSRFYPRDRGRLDLGVLPWVSMAEALGWEPGFEVVSNYSTGGDTTNRGVRRWDQPAATVTSKVDRNVVRWPFERPSPTIVGSFCPDIVAAPGWRKAGDGPRQNAPGSVRITVEEAGVLQSFPRDFPWQGPKGAQHKQAGNAIPPLLAGPCLSVVTGIPWELAAERAA